MIFFTFRFEINLVPFSLLKAFLIHGGHRGMIVSYDMYYHNDTIKEVKPDVLGLFGSAFRHTDRRY